MRRPKLSYANVVASLALFISLGGGAYAMTRLPVGSVGTKQLRNHSVTAKKIARNSLTGGQIKERTLGVVPRSKRSDFAAAAGFANNAGSAAMATNALSANAATTALKATTAATATKATTATSASSATNASHAASAATADNATNAAQLGGRTASAYLTADHVLSASLAPAAGAAKRMFTDTASGADVLDATGGVVEITNTNSAGYLTVTGVSTASGTGGVTGRSITIAPAASAKITSSAAAFLDLMITHVGTNAAGSTGLRLTCSLGGDPRSGVRALSCIGLH